MNAVKEITVDNTTHKFEITPEARLKRFLILGISGGTSIQGKQNELTKEAMENLASMVKNDPAKAVALAVQYSEEGRTINNDYCLLVLAMALTKGADSVKRMVRENLNKVARTGTHILHFTQMVNEMRGWGRLAKKTVADWYLSKDAGNLAYQMVKYKNRDGWTHRDVFRLVHPNPSGLSTASQSVFQYVAKGYDGVEHKNALPGVVEASILAHNATPRDLVKLITDFRLSHEMIPNESKNLPEVWAALLPSMGITAMIRNLNKMTAIGLLTPLSDAYKFVVNKLKSEDQIKASKVHPMQLLTAWEIYRRGQGMKGALRWTPVQGINAALEDAFYMSFQNIEPTGKNFYLGIDVSGSMGSVISENTPITCAQGAAVMAMVTVKSEPWTAIFGFAHHMKDLKISPNDRLDVVMSKVHDSNFGSTKCSEPMLHALRDKMSVDVFSVYTDNDTNTGDMSPAAALRKYRQSTGKDSKLIVVGMRTSRFSIADPRDMGMLDVVGFDPATPRIISEFSK